MAEIQFIVDKLNEPPFSKDLRLVSFDEKSPEDLLRCLQDIFEAIDPHQMTVLDESHDACIARMLSFLVMLKFPFPEHGREDFSRGLSAGEKSVVYPAMHWCLERLPQLKKRAYLARYLMPVEIPAEFMQDQALMDLHEMYLKMQADFKATHKMVDQIRRTNLNPGEIKMEIGKLEDEKKQLTEKIAKLKGNVENEPGFAEMLEVTSRLRKAQEEDAELTTKMTQQKAALKHAEGRVEDSRRRLGVLKKEAASATTATAVLAQLQREVTVHERKLSHVLPTELAQKKRRLKVLEKQADEPQRTREDVQEMEQLQYRLQRDNEVTKERIEKAIAERADSNLSMLRQPAALAAKKRADKEQEWEKLQEEKIKLVKDIEEKESMMQGIPSDARGGEVMSKEQLREYGSHLREKTKTYLRLKGELAAVRAESVILRRSEQILKDRDENLEEFLEQMEEEKGVVGYRQTHADLMLKSEQTAQVDARKSEALQEISKLVNSITKDLNSRKERLRPQIEELKSVRKEYMEVNADYEQKKIVYDKVAVGLEVERQQLEQECNGSQENALAEESRYHFLQSLCSITEARVQMIRQEERWERGEGRLLPEFQCYRDLYENKLRQQEALSKQLRRQQRHIKEKGSRDTEQRRMFSGLNTLLKIKAELAAKGTGGGADGGGLGKEGAMNEAYLKAIDAQNGSNGGGGGHGGGVADIMTLDRD